MNSGGFKVTGWCWSCVQIGLTACCQRQGPLSPTVAVISIAGLSCWWHWNPVWDGESAQWADFKKQHNICQAKVGYGGFISKHKSKLQLVNWLWNKIVPHIDGPEKCFFFFSSIHKLYVVYVQPQTSICSMWAFCDSSTAISLQCVGLQNISSQILLLYFHCTACISQAHNYLDGI